VAKDVEAIVADMAPIDSLVVVVVPGIELGKMVSFMTIQATVSGNMATICWKAVFNEGRKYGLEGDLSYLSRKISHSLAEKILAYNSWRLNFYD